uniref:Uncharacterized protein n=1 Tax=Balaenoptera musculus TaxID=9771 RepID=A0A8C0C954_BALMU
GASEESRRKPKKLVLSCTQTQSFGIQVGVEEPQWVPDQECLKCAQCNSKFNLIPRKYHLVENLPANAGDMGSSPGLGGSTCRGAAGPMSHNC